MIPELRKMSKIVIVVAMTIIFKGNVTLTKNRIEKRI